MTAVSETPVRDSATTENSREKPLLSSAIRRAGWLLRFAILLHAIGVAVAIFTRAGTPVGAIALMEWNVPHATIFLWERIAATLLLIAAGSLFLFPSTIVLLFIAALIFADGLARQTTGGEAFFEYATAAVALRYAAPLALIPLIWREKFPLSQTLRANLALWILRFGVATVFLIHGIEALRLHPGFIDLLIGSSRKLLGFPLSESAAAQILQIIGAVDILVAALALFRSWRPLLGWLAFWGFVTAISRPIAHGFASYPEVLVRASHFLAPIAIWWLVFALKSRFPDSSKTTADSGAN